MVFIKFSHTNSSHFDFSKSTQTLSTYIAFERFLADMKTLPFMFLPSYTTLIHDKWPHKNWIKRLSRSVSQSEQTNDKVPKAYHLPFIWRVSRYSHTISNQMLSRFLCRQKPTFRNPCDVWYSRRFIKLHSDSIQHNSPC